MKEAMELFKHTAKIREYCDYLDEHARKVRQAWSALQVPCKNMTFIYDDYRWHVIEAMVDAHDISKVSPEEFIQYQRNFFPVGEKDSSGFELACQHHYEENPHHWQNWTVREESFIYEAECNCVCMVLDWMAMSYKLGGSAEQYYRAKAAEIAMPAWAEDLIENIFYALKASEEEPTNDTP